jgi:hypothetical protein
MFGHETISLRLACPLQSDVETWDFRMSRAKLSPKGRRFSGSDDRCGSEGSANPYRESAVPFLQQAGTGEEPEARQERTFRRCPNVIFHMF